MSIIDVIIISLVVNFVIFLCIYLIGRVKKSNEFLDKIEDETVLYVDEYQNVVIRYYVLSSFFLVCFFILGFMFFEFIPNEIDYKYAHIILIIILLQLYKVQVYRYAENIIRMFVVTNKNMYIKTLLHKKIAISFFPKKYTINVNSIDRVKTGYGDIDILSNAIIIELNDGSVVKIYECINNDDVAFLLNNLIIRRGDA